MLCITVELLVKVGELVDKLFDLDEELMKSWITAQSSEAQSSEAQASETRLDVASSLLEAAKQLRYVVLNSPAKLLAGLHLHLHLCHTKDAGCVVVLKNY